MGQAPAACHTEPCGCNEEEGGQELSVQSGLVVGTNSLPFLDHTSVTDHLPKELATSTVQLVQVTTPLLAARAEEIAKAFYRRILETHLELFEYFNTTNQWTGRQQQAFAAALAAFAANIATQSKFGPAVDLIAAKHCALQVQPHHYLTVHEVLMAAIAEVLGPSMTPEVTAAWSEAILLLAGVLIDREETLYRDAKSRSGGWRGFRKFAVTRRQKDTKDIITFTLKPVESMGVYFDFSPGQFVTVKVDPDGDGLTAPRHYTVTSPPGMPFLQISVKRIPGGKVSNYLHDNVKDGQTVLISPPFGAFIPVPAALGESHTSVLISAGIGITPILALQQALSKRVVLAVHVDKSEEAHPFRKRFADAGTRMEAHYTQKVGRPSKDMAGQLAEVVGLDHDWYICGPSGFMCDVIRSLTARGVDASRIHFEAFGPQLCPSWSE